MSMWRSDITLNEKKAFTCLMLELLLILGCVIYYELPPSASTYAKQLHAADIKTKISAAKKLGGHWNTSASIVSDLVPYIDHADANLRRHVIQSLKNIAQEHPNAGQIHEIKEKIKLKLNDPEINIRFNAATTLVYLGKPIKPLLLTLLEGNGVHFFRFNKEIQASIVKAASLDVLISYMTHENEFIQNNTFGLLESLDESINAKLIKAAGQANLPLRVKIVELLGEREDKSLAITPQLAGLLSDRHSDVRLAVAESLSQIKPTDKQTLLMLIQALDDSDLKVTEAVGHTLREIGKPAMLQVQYALNHQNPSIVISAAQILGLEYYRKETPEVITALKSLLKDKNKRIAFHAAHAIIRVDNGMRDLALPVLNKAVLTGPPKLKQEAQEIIDDLGPTVEQHTAEFIEGLYSKDPDKQSSSRSLSSYYKLDTTQILPHLIKQSDSESGQVLDTVIYALGELKLKDEQIPLAVNVLAKYLNDPDKLLRQDVIIALGRIGIRIKETETEHLPLILNHLKTGLQDERSKNRWFTVHSLGLIGTGNHGVEDAILELIDDPMFKVSSEVESAMRKIYGYWAFIHYNNAGRNVAIFFMILIPCGIYNMIKLSRLEKENNAWFIEKKTDIISGKINPSYELLEYIYNAKYK